MTLPRISVIIPVRNAGPALRGTVAAVQAQTMPDWELLLIDDGSSDGSDALCRALAAQDSRIRAVRQSHAGVSAARNRGLALARGTYVTFCDDDDVLLPGALACQWQLAAACDADLVRTGYRLLREGEDGRLHELPHPDGAPCTLDAGSDGAAYLRFLDNSGPQFVWNALYRRAAFPGLRFDTRCRHGLEDFLYNADAFARLRRAVYDPHVTCRHREHRGGASCDRTQAALHGRLQVLDAWLWAEYLAVRRFSRKGEEAALWNRRRAMIVTFWMHQLREAGVPAVRERCVWSIVRRALAGYPQAGVQRWLGRDPKQRAALLLFDIHAQRLARLWPGSRAEREAL